ncbi:hypothetical protein K3172_14610 [Qipengyuania sp. 6B39]|uniref:hypothetical protein n=1 Tax=Qipengyuania proteolytica TaxID=2867239 RepID=UPI001C8B02AD|nr:hypothetical protein [Qipengyuania proteolytica]MBX7497088.1 hypothetical protein [Qipengyuania proteolytica]
MDAFFSSGHAVDVVLLVLALEAVVLWRRGWRGGDITTTLLPAALMLLATRAALTGASWEWIALPLAASFPVHLLDLKKRESRRRS